MTNTTIRNRISQESLDELALRRWLADKGLTQPEIVALRSRRVYDGLILKFTQGMYDVQYVGSQAQACLLQERIAARTKAQQTCRQMA